MAKTEAHRRGFDEALMLDHNGFVTEATGANLFIVKNGDRSFIFSEKGDLIIAKLSPENYHEISRAHLLDPVNRDPGRPVVWSHPAFANKSIYARNDKEIVCASLALDSAP